MKYNFVFGTIFLHNPHRIKQWVDYNVEIGVDHFCLYYHGKISFFKEKFPKEYDWIMSNKKITLIEWNIGNSEVFGVGYEFAQRGMLYHVAASFTDKTRWIGNFDLDEFIVLNDFNNLIDLVDSNKKYYSFNFGSRVCRLKGIDVEETAGGWYFHNPKTFELNDFLEYDTIAVNRELSKTILNTGGKYFYNPNYTNHLDVHGCTVEGGEKKQLYSGGLLNHYKYEHYWGPSKWKQNYWGDDIDFKLYWESKDISNLPSGCQVDNNIRKIL